MYKETRLPPLRTPEKAPRKSQGEEFLSFKEDQKGPHLHYKEIRSELKIIFSQHECQGAWVWCAKKPHLHTHFAYVHPWTFGGLNATQYLSNSFLHQFFQQSTFFVWKLNYYHSLCNPLLWMATCVLNPSYSLYLSKNCLVLETVPYFCSTFSFVWNLKLWCFWMSLLSSWAALILWPRSRVCQCRRVQHETLQTDNKQTAQSHLSTSQTSCDNHKSLKGVFFNKFNCVILQFTVFTVTTSRPLTPELKPSHNRKLITQKPENSIFLVAFSASMKVSFFHNS